MALFTGSVASLTVDRQRKSEWQLSHEKRAPGYLPSIEGMKYYPVILGDYIKPWNKDPYEQYFMEVRPAFFRGSTGRQGPVFPGGYLTLWGGPRRVEYAAALFYCKRVFSMFDLCI